MILLDKLISDAVSCIDSIIDPIEKVKAISSILPYINGEEKAPISAEIEKEVQQEVEQEVQAQTEQIKKEKAPELAPEPKQEDVIVEGDMDAIVKKFGKEKMYDIVADPDKAVLFNDSFQKVAEFKDQIQSFIDKNQIKDKDGHSIDREVFFKYHMSQVDEENPELFKNPLAMTVEQFVEVFCPYMKELHEIYGYSKEQVENTFADMSNGLRKDMGDIKPANAGALAMALRDTYKK